MKLQLTDGTKILLLILALIAAFIYWGTTPFGGNKLGGTPGGFSGQEGAAQ